MFSITGVSQAQIDKLLAALRQHPENSITEPSPGTFIISGHGVTATASFAGDVLSVKIDKKPWAYPMGTVVSHVEASIREELAK